MILVTGITGNNGGATAREPRLHARVDRRGGRRGGDPRRTRFGGVGRLVRESIAVVVTLAHDVQLCLGKKASICGDALVEPVNPRAVFADAAPAATPADRKVAGFAGGGQRQALGRAHTLAEGGKA